MKDIWANGALTSLAFQDSSVLWTCEVIYMRKETVRKYVLNLLE